jgi:hypothetical protein
VDFNQEFRLPKTPFNVIVAAGFFEFIADIDSFLNKLAAQCEGKLLLFTYFYHDDRGARLAGKDYRMNHLGTIEECISLVSRHAEDVREILQFRSQSIFSCTLNPRGSLPTTAVPSITKIIYRKKRKSSWKRLANRLKLFRGNNSRGERVN